MKFGEELASFKEKSPYADYCVDYDALKKEIQEGEDRGDFGEENEALFIKHLEDELDKVTGFHGMKLAELNQRLSHLEFLVDEVYEGERDPDANRLNRIEEELNVCSGLLTSLDRFTKINYTAFLKILKKHDKLTKYALRTMFLMRMSARPFYSEHFESQFLVLSKLYSALNSLRNGPSDTLQTREKVVRRKQKFWVHPDNVTELKIEILKHLPVIVFSRQKTDYDPGVSSVYLDNESFSCYRDRVDDTPGSEVIRIKWNGPPGRDLSDSKVRVERKTRGGGMEQQPATTAVLEVKEKYLDGFLAGTWTFAEKVQKKRERGSMPENEIAELEKLSSEIQGVIREKQLKPLVAVYFNRTAFQLVGDDSISVSLDTEVAMIRQDNFDKERTASHWRRRDVHEPYPFKSLSKEECCLFPYAVLEIDYTVSSGEEDPEWMTDLLRSGMLEPAPGFSKFVHGVANLLEDRVPLLPNWLPQLDRDIRKLAETRPAPREPESDIDEDAGSGEDEIDDSDDAVVVHEERESGAAPGADQAENRAAEEGLVGQQPRPGVLRKKRVAVPVRVEPKVFFANERTLLSWLRFSIILGGLAVGFLNFGDRVGQVSGALFSIVAMAIMLYAFALYVWRTRMIEIRYAGPYDDRIGPIVLVIALYTCVLVNLWLKFDGGVQGVLLLLSGEA